jgi:hypothetical protein
MQKLLFMLLMIMGSTPAMAMKITNLDTVVHQVAFESAGVKQVYRLAPDESVTIASQPAGKLSLVGAAPEPSSEATVHADGILSGVVGAVRRVNIPADSGDEFAIWPNGRLLLQKHRISNGSGSIF